MFRLTREVRFAINDGESATIGKPTNSYAGFPSLKGLGRFYTIAVTLAGELEPQSNYVRNIKEIDDVVRQQAVPLIAGTIRQLHSRDPRLGLIIPGALMEVLRDAWPGVKLETISLALSPFLSVSCQSREHPMIRLSEKFEFSASHRLHNPAMSDEENRKCFGKCSNPYGHGHNYEVQVTLVGKPDDNGVLVDVPALEQIVTSNVIERMDHKNLNVEVPEFKDVIPTVENIARVIYGLLGPKLASEKAKLASVTVWETPKTWCEYSE